MHGRVSGTSGGSDSIGCSAYVVDCVGAISSRGRDAWEELRRVTVSKRMRHRAALSLVLAALAACRTPGHTTGSSTTSEEHTDALSADFGFNATRDPSQPSGTFLPATLDEALHELDRGMSSGFERSFREAGANPVGLFHADFGRWMRNNWGLWSGSTLSKYFNELGVFHPDDMSGIILTSYWRRSRGVEIDLEGQVAECKAYWATIETGR